MIANGRATRKELSERYEISGRTVQRYIDELVESGVPVEAMPGKGGGYRISEGYRLHGALLGAEELDRIRAGLDALSATFPTSSDEIMGKLTCLSERESVSPRFYIDSDRWNSGGAASVKLTAITAAIDGDRTVRIEYTDRMGNCTARLLDPYTLALKEGVWYVYGFCHSHGDFRLFRLARMRSVELTDSRFERKEGDVRGALSVNLGAPMEIELEVNDSALAKAEEWLGEESLVSCKDKEGKFIFRAKVSDSYELVNKILSMGVNARVLSPYSLKERIKSAAEKIDGYYEQER